MPLTLAAPVHSELIIKKSRFIGCVQPMADRARAQDVVRNLGAAIEDGRLSQREQVARLVAAYAPWKVNTHRILTDMWYPWVIGYRRPQIQSHRAGVKNRRGALMVVWNTTNRCVTTGTGPRGGRTVEFLDRTSFILYR